MRDIASALADAANLTRLRDAARHIGVTSIRDGSWFQSVVRAYVKAHVARVDAARWDRVYPGVVVEERARREARRVAYKASAAGALASLATSSGELVSLITEGLAAPVGIPAAILAIVLEAAYTSLLQIDLACDLGLIYGVPFDADDAGEIATLFGLALELDVYSRKLKEEEDEAGVPRGLMARLMHLEEGEIGARIGRKLLEEALLRNVLPVVGVGISARWNYVATLRFAAKVRKHMRCRRALRAAIGQLRLGAVTDPTMLVEGCWLLVTSDGEAGHEEMLALAAIMDLLTPEQKRALSSDRALAASEQEWLGALAAVDKPMQPALLDTLYLVAAADHELAVAERRFLERAAAALGRTVDLARAEQLASHLARGETPPLGAA
jgi:hypothetical protein